MNIVIMGGGRVGQNLARRLIDNRNRVQVIEADRDRCARLANALDTEIICGDGTEIEVLENAGIRDADIFIAITDNDADNLVAAQLAKKYFGAKKIIARANDPRNVETMRVLGVDHAVSSTEVLATLIEQEARPTEVRLLASLNKGRAQISSFILPQDSALHGKSLNDLSGSIPRGALLVSVVRADKLIIPRGDTVLQRGDEVIAVSEEGAERALYRLMAQTEKTG